VTPVTRGRFITFEGGEGVGKSTQVRRLAERLRGLDQGGGGEVVVTREPGGSPGAEAIRALLVNGPVERWSPISETLLMYAARRDHIERVIVPALERGAWVICDRFYDSSRAYQGVAGGAPAGLLKALEADVVGDLVPDLTLILDLPASVGLARAAQRGKNGRGKIEGRFEAKGAEFHERLRAAFLAIAAGEPDRCRVINADADIDVVTQRIGAAVEAKWGAVARAQP
jgi:dTMP kinase